MSDGTHHRNKGPVALALAAGLLAALDDEEVSYEGLKRRLRAEVRRDPLDAVFAFTTSVAWLYYQAEHGTNPAVKSYGDALMYVSTSLSVGYHNTFPCTETGKLIAAVVHAIGPGLAAGALAPPAAEAEPTR